MPSHWDLLREKDIDLQFKPGQYSLPIGIVFIDHSQKIKVDYRETGAGIVEPHIFSAVLSHLSTSGYPKYAEQLGENGKLHTLTVQAGQYSQNLLELILSDIQESAYVLPLHTPASFLNQEQQKRQLALLCSDLQYLWRPCLTFDTTSLIPKVEVCHVIEIEQMNLQNELYRIK